MHYLIVRILIPDYTRLVDYIQSLVGNAHVLHRSGICQPLLCNIKIKLTFVHGMVKLLAKCERSQR